MNDINIDELSDDQLRRLADRLQPHFRQLSLLNNRVFGDPSRLHVGENVSLVDTLFNTVCGHIHIGDYAFFGHGVMVLTGTHAVDQINKERQIGVPNEGRDIVIGRGAWIASGAIVLGPCRIGADAVIGAGSVVLGGEVPSGWFYAGSPARPIKQLIGVAEPEKADAPKTGWRRLLGRFAVRAG